MKVRMTETKKGSPDGVQINIYKVGKEYDLPGGPKGLGTVFCEELEVAELVPSDAEPTDNGDTLTNAGTGAPAAMQPGSLDADTVLAPSTIDNPPGPAETRNPMDEEED